MDKQLYKRKLHDGLCELEQEGIHMPGIHPPENKDNLIAQMLDSIRRVEYVYAVKSRSVSANRKNPHDVAFDPIRAAVWYYQNGNNEEASWLVFLSTHFGKNANAGWSLTKDIYGSLGQGLWDWQTVSQSPHALSQWIANNHQVLKSGGMRFGNHRKYESLTPGKRGWTGDVLESYIYWVMAYGSHFELFKNALEKSNGDPCKAFNQLYHSMDIVQRFGRTGKFDYLTMISKIGIADIIADRAYLNEATGPLKGARLLFGGRTSANIGHADLEERLSAIDRVLQVGMQVLEDSLCNWQKSPGRYKYFKG